MKMEFEERGLAPGEDAGALDQGLADGFVELRPVADPVEEKKAVAAPRGHAATFTQNSLLSIGRLVISTLVSLVLPAFLVHRLPVQTYSAWVLILQMSAYVGYLEFGVQTGIAKYVAEYEARGDNKGASLRASAGMAITLGTCALGLVLTAVLGWRVPDIFHEMPTDLYHDVRLSVLFVGAALSLSLVFSIFGTIFIGLQRYTVPTVIALASRILFTAAVVVAVALKSSLAWMGATVAVVYLATGLLQYVAWRKMANHIRLSLREMDRGVLRQMIGYCSSLAISTVGMLCVTGLDVTIVGRYDYAQTGRYSIATAPTNFIISIATAALGPLLPMVSALAVSRTPGAMGALLTKTTRYASTLLLAGSVPLLVCGFWVFRAWVGPAYATQAVTYMRILLIANVIRNLCLPYSSMMVSVGKQKVGIAGAAVEAVVNLGSSIFLVKHIGAVGVAYGTLIGSMTSVAMHFAVSMHFTFAEFSVTRTRLFLSGMLRPAMLLVPALLVVRRWWLPGTPTLGMGMLAALCASTLAIGFYVCLDGGERGALWARGMRLAGRGNAGA